MGFRSRGFKISDLRLIASGDEFQDSREPVITLGAVVRLNSGGPRMLVVDISDGGLTCAWRAGGKTEEHTFPRGCVHRVRDAW